MNNTLQNKFASAINHSRNLGLGFTIVRISDLEQALQESEAKPEPAAEQAYQPIFDGEKVGIQCGAGLSFRQIAPTLGEVTFDASDCGGGVSGTTEDGTVLRLKEVEILFYSSSLRGIVHFLRRVAKTMKVKVDG